MRRIVLTLRQCSVLLCLISVLLLNTGNAFADDAINWIKGFDKGMSYSRTSERPVFIYFYAPWCSWCYVYERDTLGNRDVIARVSEYFVPVLVNFDARPDLVKRFRGFGLPFTVILSSDGELLARVPGILEPQDMQLVLQQIVDTQAVKRLPTVKILLSVNGLKASDYQRFLVRWLDHLEDLYDHKNGTFSGVLDSGALLKRPAPLAWTFLLQNDLWSERTKLAVHTTLDNLYESKHGGFFYYRDPHRRDLHIETAKLVNANAWLIRWFSLAARQYNDARLLAVARHSSDYLQQVLWDREKGGFFQAQVSDIDYYKSCGREISAPAIDRIKRVDTNAQAAVALMETGKLIGDYELVKTAMNTIRYLMSHHLQSARLYHSYSDDGFGAAYNLADDIFWLLTAMQAAGEIDPAFVAPEQTQAVHELANQWLVNAMRDKTKSNHSNKLLGIIAWTAVNSDNPLIPSQTVNWALSRIRIETTTRPDELVYALKAWQRYLKQ